MSDLMNGRAALDTCQVGTLVVIPSTARTLSVAASYYGGAFSNTLNQNPVHYLLRQGIIFVGGFSYADTLDSAKGWAGTIRFNDRLLAQFKAFYNR